MTNDYVHIVCLDAPCPPDYGGAIDMYQKILALHSVGRKIILHYFNYKENRNAAGLEAYCEEINVYGRTSFLKSLLTLKPYIVSSRIEPELIHRLNRDDYPVLLEGIHCSGIIPHINSKKRIVVRVHNDEAAYYRTLYNQEQNFLRKFYFLYEANLLARYQETLADGPTFAFIALSDQEAFRKKYDQGNQVFISSFIPWQKISSRTGIGEYCLYHGNLSISENSEAVSWLIENVFSKLKVPLVVAGRDAKLLEGTWPGAKEIQLVNDPSDSELSGLIQDAHINVLPSMNATGVKLKLLHALCQGRFCISNDNGISGTGIENHIIPANTASEWIEVIQEKMFQDFTKDMVGEREKILTVYNNTKNAEKLSALL